MVSCDTRRREFWFWLVICTVVLVVNGNTGIIFLGDWRKDSSRSIDFFSRIWTWGWTSATCRWGEASRGAEEEKEALRLLARDVSLLESLWSKPRALQLSMASLAEEKFWKSVTPHCKRRSR
jgi:hypothetical protein